MKLNRRSFFGMLAATPAVAAAAPAIVASVKNAPPPAAAAFIMPDMDLVKFRAEWEKASWETLRPIVPYIQRNHSIPAPKPVTALDVIKGAMMDVGAMTYRDVPSCEECMMGLQTINRILAENWHYGEMSLREVFSAAGPVKSLNDEIPTEALLPLRRILALHFYPRYRPWPVTP